MGMLVSFLVFVAGGLVLYMSRLSSHRFVRVVTCVCGFAILLDVVLSLLHVI